MENLKQNHLLSKLNQLRDRKHIPVELVDLLGAVSQLQIEASQNATFILPDSTRPVDELLAGRALVDREQFPFDKEQATALFSKILDLAQDIPGPLSQAARTISQAVASDELDLDFAFAAVLNDDKDFFATWADRTPEAPQALYFLAYAAMSPSITAVSEQLGKRLPKTSAWPMGTCPVCGGLPLISRLEGKEGIRINTCSFCSHEYRVLRISCSICGEHDQKKLTYFNVNEEPGFRVDVCASCKNYLKTIDFRAMDRKSIPAFDDLDSISLDFVARKQGFKRATLSAWGF